MRAHQKYFIALILIAIAPLSWADSLTLAKAEAIAVARAPELAQSKAKQQALQQQAIAAGQLPDPKLTLGALNMPVDSFDLSQEAMTQLQVGLQQSFPRGRSLKYQAQQQHYLSEVAAAKTQATRIKVLRSLRHSWLDLTYWLQAKKLVTKQKKVFQHLVEVTESLLANNKAQQKDVIRAQLELNDLSNRLIQIDQQVKTSRAQLARWLGAGLAAQATPTSLQRWHKPPTLLQMQRSIEQHPELKTDEALIAADKAGVKLAKQQYKPGFTLGMAYGFRQGDNFNGADRADLVSAQVSLDLPVFAYNRQDRIVKASHKNLNASQTGQVAHYRELFEALQSHYIAWQQLGKNVNLYQRELVPQAKQYAEATLVAYQNDQTDFPTLARSYVRELDTQLAGLKAKVDRNKARVDLLYLQGK